MNSEPAAEKKREEPTDKGKEVIEEATNKELVEVTSEEIFAGCGSIKKV